MGKIKKTLYSVVQINKFAEKKNISVKDAFLYLNKFGAIDFLDECYDIEHTLSDDIVFEDLEGIAKRNGGDL